MGIDLDDSVENASLVEMNIRNEKGLFDEQLVHERLVSLNDLVDWEVFRELCEGAFSVRDPQKGGRPSFDKVMLLKILILQRIYDLSDAAAEFQITDRLSFRAFLGLELQHKYPMPRPSGITDSV